MLKGGVIMDVVNVEQARIAEEAGAVAVMVRQAQQMQTSRVALACVPTAAKSTLLLNGQPSRLARATTDPGERDRPWNACPQTSARREEWHA